MLASRSISLTGNQSEHHDQKAIDNQCDEVKEEQD